MTHSDDGGSGDDDQGDDNDDQGDDDNSGDDNSGDGNGEQQCTTADLTAGTQVSEAELNDENGQPTFEEIKLVK